MRFWLFLPDSNAWHAKLAGSFAVHAGSMVFSCAVGGWIWDKLVYFCTFICTPAVVEALPWQPLGRFQRYYACLLHAQSRPIVSHSWREWLGDIFRGISNASFVVSIVVAYLGVGYMLSKYKSINR